MNISPLFVRTIRWFGHLLPLSRLIEWSKQFQFLPFYHSVQDGAPIPHLQHLYKLRTVSQFESDLDFLLEYYRPVDLPELIDMVKEKRPSQTATFFLSFDDGLREVYDIVAPILKRKGVPATFFLNSAFVDNKDLFFRYKASILVDRIKKTRPSEALIKQLGACLETPVLSVNEICKSILGVSYQQQKILDDIAPLLEVDFADYLKTREPYLKTAQINQLLKK